MSDGITTNSLVELAGFVEKIDNFIEWCGGSDNEELECLETALNELLLALEIRARVIREFRENENSEESESE